MVEFVDGSVLAQLGPPDMRLPIHYALHYPERAPNDLRGFDLGLFRELTFEAVDPERYPALALGYRCVRAGGDAGAALNAADEVAVGAFLERRIGFGEILPIDEAVLARRNGRADTVEALLASDVHARSLARAEVTARERPLAPR
jgi:1-deoxy-D-xylulose-5-phosphate reductoisomerase